MARHMAPFWCYKNIKFYCDNSSASYALINKRAKLQRRDMEFLVTKFCELSAEFHFRFWVEHIPGKENELADALSRFKTVYAKGGTMEEEWNYVPQREIVESANSILSAISRLPLNDDDPRLGLMM